jgi:hypothetical protein
MAARASGVSRGVGAFLQDLYQRGYRARAELDYHGWRRRAACGARLRLPRIPGQRC